MNTRFVRVLVVLGIVGCGDNLSGPGPETVIDQPPAMLSSRTRVEVTFHAVGAAASFTCSLDDEAPAACASPWTLEVADGMHQIAIAAIGVRGAVGEPATASFAVDTKAPDTAISVGPSAVEMATIASFTFAASPAESGATFECALDGAAFTACTSPATTPVLADGDHVFRVRATDAAGNADPTPAMHAWSIDTMGPPIALVETPADPSNVVAPTFRFSSTEPSATFECEIDGVTTFAPCTSPYIAPPLGDGMQTFRVRATDAVQNQSTAGYTWTVDTIAPTVTIESGPSGPTNDATPTWTFTTTGAPVVVECVIDGGTPMSCAGTFTSPPLGSGPHVFEVHADDAAGNTGSAMRSFAVELGMCGNGIVESGELCDGGDLAGATCESQGHAPGTLGCAPACDGYAIAGCDGGFVAANIGFTGKVGIDGVKFNRPGGGNFLAVCAEDTGVFRATTTPTTVSWTNINGATAPNLRGRAVLTSYDNPSVLYIADNTDGVIEPNGFRSNSFESGAPAWMAPPVSFSADGQAIEVFTAHPGTSTNNHIGGWHPMRGAVVLHGSFNASATVSNVGTGVTGTVTGISIPVFTGTTTDVTVAVFGRTPAGAPAVGGLYWSCDQIGTAGGNYVQYDNGIAPADKPLVYSITADTFSFNTATPRLCQSTGLNVFGFAAIKYAAVRGGNRVYKTIDGGLNWSPSNNGIPVGAEVYAIAIDCIGTIIGSQCNNHDLLFAATSVGLYKSTDGGGIWALAGFEGKDVRAVALQPDHPLGTAPRILVGVDDTIGIYQKLP